MTDGPRIPLVNAEDAPKDIQEILERWPFRLHRALANSPDTMRAWMVFGEHILHGNALPERDREVAILRVAWNCRSPYEWGLHGRLARSIGFTDDDLEAITDGPNNAHLPEHENLLIKAVDEMQSGWSIEALTFERLKKFYDSKQLIDLLFVVGQFILVALTLNSLGLPVEDGVEPFPNHH